jgi:hypothetical protein
MGRLSSSLADGFFGALSVIFGALIILGVLFLIYYFGLRHLDVGGWFDRAIQNMLGGQ